MKVGRSLKDGSAMKVSRSLEKKVKRSMRLKRRRLTKLGDEIPEVDDVWEKQEGCVLLFGHTADDATGHSKAKVIAWYPEKGVAGLLSTPLLPPMYRPLYSCGGFICGMHVECLREESEWKFRVAVSNPARKYEVELPVLDIIHLPPSRCDAEWEFATGRLRLKMTPPLYQDQLFRVHLTTSYKGENTVHSFNTSTWRWESSTTFSGEHIGSQLVGELLFRYRNLRSLDVATRKWTAIAGPESWDADFPIPERFSGSKYSTMFPFRYGKKIMGACTLSRCEFVLLELQECEGWKVVASADPEDFPSCSFDSTPHSCKFCVDWPQVRGDLLVLQSAGFSRPLAFNLRHHSWTEVPPLLADSNLFLHCVCVYEPPSNTV